MDDIGNINLAELFIYDGNNLLNRITRNPRAIKGEIAGTKHHSGYIQIGIDGKLYMAHRIIWYMVNGEIPSMCEIDHINHVRDDNRIDNLRLVSRQDNRRNQSKSTKNKSGVIGVSRYNPRNKWQSQIKVDGKNIHLGFYDEFDDAVKVRKEAEEKYGFHKNHGKGITNYGK